MKKGKAISLEFFPLLYSDQREKIKRAENVGEEGGETWRFDTPFVSTDYRRTSRNNRILGKSRGARTGLGKALEMQWESNTLQITDPFVAFRVNNGLFQGSLFL